MSDIHVLKVKYIIVLYLFTFTVRKSTRVESIADQKSDFVSGVSQDVDCLLVCGAKKRLAVHLNDSLTDLHIQDPLTQNNVYIIIITPVSSIDGPNIESDWSSFI